MDMGTDSGTDLARTWLGGSLNPTIPWNGILSAMMLAAEASYGTGDLPLHPSVARPLAGEVLNGKVPSGNRSVHSHAAQTAARAAEFV